METQKKEGCYMPIQRTLSSALLILKGTLRGKKIPIVFRVYKTKLKDCKEISQKGAVRSSITTQ
jgi:hypothetical protein